MNLTSTIQTNNFSLNLTELQKAKLDKTQIVVFGISTCFSLYLFLCTLHYTIVKWKDKLRFDNCCCLFTTLSTLLGITTVLCRIVFWRYYLSTCPILQSLVFTSLTLSRCSAHLVFRSRYNLMYRSKKKKALFYTIFIIIASMLQLLVFYFTAFLLGNPMRCISGMPIKVSLYVSVLFYFTIFTLQTVMLVMIIRPVLKHWKNLEKSNSDIRNEQMINVLKRLFLSLLIYVVSDVILIVSSLVFASINTWLPVFTLINMNINSVSIIFSFADFKQRFMPLTIKDNRPKQVKSFYYIYRILFNINN